MYERAAAMPSSLTYRQSVLLGCTVSPVRPALLPFGFGPPFVESSTSRFSEACNTSRRNGERQRSFEIGESICGLEESQNLKDHERNTGKFSTTTSLHVADRKNYPL